MSLVEYHGEHFERPNDNPRGLILAGVVAALVLGGAIGAWASFAEVARAAMAPSTIVVEGSVRPIQHRDGGPVGEVLVREGELVAAGDVIVRLDLSDVRAEVDVLTAQRLQALAKLARVRAEAAEAETIVFPPELEAHRNDPTIGQVMDQQASLFEARRTSFLGGRRLLEQQMAGYREQILGLEGQIRKTNDQIVLIDEELVGLRQLLEKGLTPKTRVLLLQREAADLGGELEGLKANVATANNEIHRAELEIEQLKKQRREEIATSLADLDGRLAEIEPALAAAQDRLSRVDLVAPVSGVVLNLAVHGQGATITPGQVVAEIVPQDQPLIVKARIDPNDVDQVRPGQAVDLHILAYKQRYQSIIPGVLRSVSPDRIEDPITHIAYFSGTIAIDQAALDGSKVALIPGMSATAVIKTGTRTVMDYFLDPIYHVYDFALKED